MEFQEQFLRRASQGLTPFSALIAAPVTPAWTPLGPAPIPNGQTDPTEVAVSGRVTAIAVDPASDMIVYVGTAQGGLYRSLDGGANWTALMDSAQSLAIGAITIDPLNHDTVFVGTGEGNLSGDSFFGVGLYIIRNASTVSPVLSGPFNSNGTSDVFTGRAITRILVNPADDNKILVSTASGVSGLSSESFSTLPQRGVYLSANALGAYSDFHKADDSDSDLGRARPYRDRHGDGPEQRQQDSGLRFRHRGCRRRRTVDEYSGRSLGGNGHMDAKSGLHPAGIWKVCGEQRLAVRAVTTFMTGAGSDVWPAEARLPRREA